MIEPIGTMPEQRRAHASEPAPSPLTIQVTTGLALVITGRRPGPRAVVELWTGSTLIGIMHEEPGGLISIRLESRVRGPLTLDARALEKALAAAREQLQPMPPESAERDHVGGP